MAHYASSMAKKVGKKKAGGMVGGLAKKVGKKKGSTASYKPGNVRKGAKAGPGTRGKAAATGGGGSTSRISHLSGARQRRIRQRRNA